VSIPISKIIVGGDDISSQIRRYYFNNTFSQASGQFRRPLRTEKEEVARKLRKLGEPFASLVPRILAIPGVTEVRVLPSSFQITKGRAFRWIEIERPLFVEVFKTDNISYLGVFLGDLPLVNLYGPNWEERFISNTASQIEPRIVVKKDLPLNTQVYHLTCEISHYPGQWWMDHLLDEGIEGIVGKVGTSLLRQLWVVGGIRKISIESYRLLVIKEEGSDWRKIDDGVIKALKGCFGEDKAVKVFRM